MALEETPALSAASVNVAAAAAVVCLTALDMDEKKLAPPPPGCCCWLVDWRLSDGPGDTAGLCCGGSGRCRSAMYPLGRLDMKLLSDSRRRR